MRNYLFYFFFLMVGLSFAQEAHILFNRMNMGVYNPAFTGVNGPSLLLSNRSQWLAIEDAPQTNYLIYQLPQKKNVLLGFTAQNDRVFIENKTHFTIDYNYQLKFSENHFLYLGLKGGGFYNSINTDRLQRIYNTYNPALAAVQSYFTPVLGMGVHFRAPNYFIGIGMPSIFTNTRYQNNEAWETTATDIPYLYLSGGYTLALDDTFSLAPIFIYRTVPESSNIFSGTVAVHYKDQLALGTGYTNNHNLAFFMTSKSVKGIEWGYGYEFMTGASETTIQTGTHEFFVRFSIDFSASEESQNTKSNED